MSLGTARQAAAGQRLGIDMAAIQQVCVCAPSGAAMGAQRGEARAAGPASQAASQKLRTPELRGGDHHLGELGVERVLRHDVAHLRSRARRGHDRALSRAEVGLCLLPRQPLTAGLEDIRVL